MFGIEFWECPECGQRIFNWSEEAIKNHRCASQLTDEEIDAVLDKVLGVDPKILIKGGLK